MRNVWLILALVGAIGAVWGAEAPPGLVFHAPFDGSFDAAIAAGSKAGRPEGKPEFMPGRVGQAVVVGDIGGSTAVNFDPASFDLDRGTLSLWVQPLNWQGDDRQNHLFFEAKTDGGYYLLYKYQNTSWGAAFYIDPDEGRRATMVAFKPINEWRPGEWHHVACSWTRYEAIKLYLDGQLVKSSLGVGLSKRPLIGPLRFGGAWQSNGDRTALDEAMIFNRMLSDAEIAALAGQEPPAPPAEGEPRDVPGIMLSHAVLGHQVLARVYDDALGQPVRQAQLGLWQDGKPVTTQDLALKPGLNEARVDLTAVPLGEYQARLTLLREGQPVATEALRVPVETRDTWQTAHELGREDPVLPPFEPLKVAGQRLQWYSREAELNAWGLPARIKARGTEMLAAPVAIVAADGAGELVWKGSEPKVQAASQSKATLTSSAQSQNLNVRTKIETRYDGTMWFSLTFEPGQPVDLERLRIEVPYRSETAPLYAYSAYGRLDAKRFGYGATPPGQGVVWQREFLPSIWLGTEDYGLGWYADSDQHWDIEGEEALTLEREGETLKLCMNVIRSPRRVEKPFTIEFGLQATPVRPLQADWRSYQMLPSSEITRYFLNMRGNPYPRADVAGQTPHGKVTYLYAYHDYFTNTLPKDPEEFRQMIQKVKEYGLLGTPYTDTTFMPEDHGDLLLRPDVLCYPPARASSYGPHGSIDACHNGPFADWYVWYIHHLIDTYGINGIYFDDMSPYGCANEAHGCGYVGPDGKRRPTYAMRARTETFRRVRELFAKTGEPFFILYHISAGRVPPLATYGDGLLMAEERNPLVGKNPDYTENTTSEEWRASFSPEAWGIPVYMLPQFKMDSAWMKDPELAEKLLAAVVPHDLLIWPLFAHEGTLLAARKVQEEFGIGERDVKLLPFWHKGTGIRCESEKVWLTGYLRPGKLLLCASNPTAEAIRTVLHVDRKRLGLAEGEETIEVTLEPKRVRFVEVK